MEQIRSPPNGIWMCGEHADLIDKNSGVRYSVEILQSWKALHESRIAYEHSGRLATFGFVQALTIAESALFVPNTRIELAKATLVIGANGSGKTAICEWLYSLASPVRLLRWAKRSSSPALDLEVSFSAPIKRTLHVSVPEKIPQLELDGVRVAANPLPIAVTYLEKSDSSTFVDDLDMACTVLGIDKGEAQTLASFIDSQSVFLSAAEWRRERDDDGKWGFRLYVQPKNGASMRQFGSLSGSEKNRALLDLAIARAKLTAAFVPSLLLVEVSGLSLDWGSLRPYMEIFSQSRTPFQTVITSWELTAEMEGFGWQVYRILGDKQQQRVEGSRRCIQGQTQKA